MVGQVEADLIARRQGFDLRRASAIRPPWLQRPVAQATLVLGLGLMLGVYSVGLAVLPPHLAPMFAVVALCPFVGLIIGNIRRLLLAVIIIDVPLSIGTHLNYQIEMEKVGSLAGLNVSITTLALPLLFALWGGDLLLRQEPRIKPVLRPALPLLLYVGAAIISVPAAINPTLSQFEIFLLLQSTLLFIYVTSTVRTRSDVLFITAVLSAMVIVQSALMFATFLLKTPLQIATISTRIDDGGRIGGTVGGPNAAAAFLGILLAPALAMALSPVERWYRRLGALAFVCGTAALALTMSRGGWIALGLSVGMVVLLAWRRGWLAGTVPMSILLALALALALFRDSVFARFTSNDAGSAESRVPLMRIALNMVRDHPIFGVGANNFGAVLPGYVTPEFSADWLYTVHNKYLLIWAEIGPVGLVAFLVFLIVTLRRGWQVWRRGERAMALIALGYTGGVVGQMSHMFVDILNGRQQVQLLWLIAGLLVAMLRLSPEPNAEATRPPTPRRSNRRRLTPRPSLQKVA